jgi:hypothetical protein
MPETESWTLLDLDVVRCTDGNLTVDHPRRGNTRNHTLERLKAGSTRPVRTGEKSTVNTNVNFGKKRNTGFPQTPNQSRETVKKARGEIQGERDEEPRRISGRSKSDLGKHGNRGNPATRL